MDRFSRFALIAIATATLHGVCPNTSNAADGPPPNHLRCELRESPIGIQTSSPRLSWQPGFLNDSRGVVQIAYQILVATNPDLLTPENADIWNSERKNSGDSLHIPYHGKTLKSDQQIWWTVRTWDQDDKQSAWSKPDQFTTALLSENDWHAKWVGAPPVDKNSTMSMDMANWIWGTKKQDSLDNHAGSMKPGAGAIRYFRKSFILPSGADLEKAKLYIAADNEAAVYLNGHLIGKTDTWKNSKKIDPSKSLIPNAGNQLNIVLKNGGNEPNSAGLAAVLFVPQPGNGDFIVATDATWEVSRDPDTRGWPNDLVAKAKAAANWQPVRYLGAWGIAPWNNSVRGDPPTLPILRKEFALTKPVKRAVTHISGLGQYVLSINGKKTGNHFLDPAWSLYEKTVYYNSFDVTSDLRSGKNTVGVMLGKGFYNTSGDRRIHGVYSDRPLKLITQTHIEFDDGSTTEVVSDASWKWAVGPLTHSSILGGADYDARLLPEGWNKSGFDDSKWKSVEILEAPTGKLVAAIAPPMRTFQEMQPIDINQPEPGHYVYDFGQNAAASPRLSVHGKAGATIQLTWAEQREGQSPHTNDGKGLVDQSGIGSGYFTYTLRGGDQDEEWFSQTVYTGYQYMELTGGVPAGFPNPDNKPVVTQLTSVHVHADEPQVGTFKTSNDMYNRIDTMIAWAVRNNLSHVFTDCPTREKLGWLEVPWLMWASVASRYELDAYGEKISGDIRDSQLPDGKILTVAPSFFKGRDDFHYTLEWGAAGVFLPWDTYTWYDDSRALEDNYEMMRGYVDYLTSSSDNLIAKGGLGDWYDYEPGAKPGASKFTPPDLSATATFVGCADIVSSAAAVLGKPEDRKKYAELAKNIRAAFNNKFHTGPGRYKNNGSPQTGNAMALVFHIVPESERADAAQVIVDDLKKRGWQQTSGDVGYHFLVTALSDTGHSDAIFHILNRTELGSYAYLVNSGWTSLPEAWNANHTSSMDHCMLGHIQQWFTQRLVGIAPAPGSVGFNRIAIQPTPGEGVTSATGSLDFPRGKIAVSWKLEDQAFSCEVTIPPNTKADISLPIPSNSKITESGKSLTDVAGITHKPRADNREKFEAGSGIYHFKATW